MITLIPLRMKVGLLFPLTDGLGRSSPSPSLKIISPHKRALKGGRYRGEDWRQWGWAGKATFCVDSTSNTCPYPFLLLGSLVITTDFRFYKTQRVRLDTQHHHHPFMPEGNGLRATFTCFDDLILNPLKKINTFKFVKSSYKWESGKFPLPGGKEGWGINWEIGIDIYTLLYIK